MKTNLPIEAIQQVFRNYRAIMVVFVSRFLALIGFIPFCALGAPVVFYTTWRHGAGNLAARNAQQDVMANSWTLQPFLWAHRVLCCHGNVLLQKW